MCYERRDPEQAKACFERDQRKVEYIEREAVRDEFYQCVLDGTITSVEDTGKFLRSFPAANVAPVVHGRWVLIERTIGMETYRCSECKDEDFWNTRFCFGYENYCHNCGARMDGE